MKQRNGFVFMETIVVIAVLSITLLLLFGSYSYILRKSRSKNTFDTTESIYKTYYVKQLIDNYKKEYNRTGKGVEVYINDHLSSGSECTKQTYGGYYSFICDLSSDSYNGYLSQAKKAFEVDKFYYLNPKQVVFSASSNEWLNKFDATTIDYIRSISASFDKYILIVKYKKYYRDGSYEVFHSSMEVNSWCVTKMEQLLLKY